MSDLEAQSESKILEAQLESPILEAQLEYLERYVKVVKATLRVCNLCEEVGPAHYENGEYWDRCKFCVTLADQYGLAIEEATKRFVNLPLRRGFQCFDILDVFDNCETQYWDHFEIKEKIAKVLSKYAEVEYDLHEEKKALAKKVLVDSPPYLVCGDAFSIIAEYLPREYKMDGMVFYEIWMTLREQLEDEWRHGLFDGYSIL